MQICFSTWLLGIPPLANWLDACLLSHSAYCHLFEYVSQWMSPDSHSQKQNSPQPPPPPLPLCSRCHARFQTSPFPHRTCSKLNSPFVLFTFIIVTCCCPFHSFPSLAACVAFLYKILDFEFSSWPINPTSRCLSFGEDQLFALHTEQQLTTDECRYKVPNMILEANWTKMLRIWC